MKKILFTGFEPFGGEEINPSWEAVKLLPETINGAMIIKESICVEYARCETALCSIMARHRPDAAVLCGQAGGRDGISVECCAINMDHALSPDNAGEVRRYKPISPDGPAAYFTSAPVEKLVSALEAASIPCAPSFSAGTYVCNHIYYTLLSSAPAMGLFIHVPFIPSQAQGKGAPSMELSEIARALKITAGVISENLS